jgi:hypothetical protein
LAQNDGAHSQDIQNEPGLDAQPDTLSGADIPVHQPDKSVVDLKLIDFSNFLRQYEASCPNLQMTCPWVGIPLPSIHIELDLSLGLSTKIEFSHELGTRFIEYIRSRDASSKVSD